MGKQQDSIYFDDSSKHITEKGLTSSSAQIIPTNSIVFSSRAPIGHINIVKKEYTTNQGCKSIFPVLVDIEFIYWLIKNRTSDIQKRASGTTFKEISGSGFGDTVICIPPLSEQKRISQKIDELFEKVNSIEADQGALQQLADQLKQKVLDIAMQGKLVPQDPNDEPASVLLEKIRAEKQKLFEEGKLKEKDLVESEIVKGVDNAYYEKLPASWEIQTLGSLYSVTSSKRVLKDEWTDTGIPFYRAREIVSIKMGRPLKDPIFISEETYKSKISVSGQPKLNDILITGVGTLGVTYVVYDGHIFYFKDGNVVWLRSLGDVNSKFIEKAIESPRITKIINETSGTTVGTLTIDKTKALVVPVPPKEEQDRLVCVIDMITNQLALLTH